MAVTVLSGANEATLDVEGRSVGTVRHDLARTFNIPDGAQATINGKNVPDSTILADGDELSFVKATARKG